VGWVREVIHRLEILDSSYSRFMRKITGKINSLRRYRQRLGVTLATSWGGFGNILGCLRQRFGVA
jgi:hypothetical protein